MYSAAACFVLSGAVAASPLLLDRFPQAQSIQPSCPCATLPAYSHNDYENARPLLDALDFGFRGIEADLFLVDGTLRVGHDRRSAQRGKTLEALYLEPLRAIISKCGTIVSNRRPFLLALELKENSQQSYVALLQLLARYSELFEPQRESAGGAIPIEVVLVGWHPPASELHPDRDRFVTLQHRISQLDGATLSAPGMKGWF